MGINKNYAIYHGQICEVLAKGRWPYANNTHLTCFLVNMHNSNPYLLFKNKYICQDKKNKRVSITEKSEQIYEDLRYRDLDMCRNNIYLAKLSYLIIQKEKNVIVAFCCGKIAISIIFRSHYK